MPGRDATVWIGDRLHRHILRAMKGRTQAEVAREAGLSRQYVHNVVTRSDSSRDRERLGRLLEVLGLDLDAYDTDPSERPQPWTLPSKFDFVSNQDRAEIERILSWMLRIREDFRNEAGDRERGHDRPLGPTFRRLPPPSSVRRSS